MGFDDICNAGLVLGLGISSNTDSPLSMAGDLKPKRESLSLTLSLSGENYDPGVVEKVASKTCKDQFAAGSYCEASSFSNASVAKMERKFGSSDDGAETERVSSRLITDEDDDGSNSRKKLRLTKVQSALLEESFKRHTILNPRQKHELARDLKLSARQVEVWFQNRRARKKLRQMEVDSEMLKKCFESLTDENRRLQKEIQELKALKITQTPLYMQLPAATLNMCPSCENICQTTTKTPFTINPKPQFYNSFPNPSAAC